MPLSDPRSFLRSLFDAAVAAADPMRCVPAALPPKPAGRVVVIGAGKASARMAEAVETAWGPCEGLVLTRYGYGRPTRGIEIVEAAHPVPDARGLAATARMLQLVEGLGEGDFVLAADLRWRLGAARATGGRDHAGREAGGQRRAPRLRRADRRDEHRAQAPVPREGRPARGGRLAGADARADDLRHSRRRPGAHRVRADRGGRIDPGRRAGDPRALGDPGPALRRGRPRRADGRAAAGRASPRPDREPGDRRAVAVARGRSRAGRGRRVQRAAARRRDRGRGARGGRGPGRTSRGRLSPTPIVPSCCFRAGNAR